MQKKEIQLCFPKAGKKLRSRKNKTEFTEKARKAIHKRDEEICFFCRQQYHMDRSAGFGELQIMHVVPRSQMGLGVEENGVLGCPYHHALMDNGNKGLRPEMIGMLERYLQDIYPGWSQERVTFSKYAVFQEINKSQNRHQAEPQDPEQLQERQQESLQEPAGGSRFPEGPPEGFTWI